MNEEIFSYIVIIALFLTMIIPLSAGAIHYSRENKKLRELRRESEKKIKTI